MFIGQSYAIPGMSTVLRKMISVEKVGWTKLKPWKPQSISGPLFSAGGCFDFLHGKYEI